VKPATAFNLFWALYDSSIYLMQKEVAVTFISIHQIGSTDPLKWSQEAPSRLFISRLGSTTTMEFDDVMIYLLYYTFLGF
jgi:hypothetical protein